MNDYRHIGAPPEDLGVNEALQVDLPVARIDGLAIERELDDVLRRNLARGHVAGEKKAVRPLVVAHADMAESIDHALVEQDVIG